MDLFWIHNQGASCKGGVPSRSLASQISLQSQECLVRATAAGVVQKSICWQRDSRRWSGKGRIELEPYPVINSRFQQLIVIFTSSIDRKRCMNISSYELGTTVDQMTCGSTRTSMIARSTVWHKHRQKSNRSQRTVHHLSKAMSETAKSEQCTTMADLFLQLIRDASPDLFLRRLQVCRFDAA